MEQRSVQIYNGSRRKRRIRESVTAASAREINQQREASHV